MLIAKSKASLVNYSAYSQRNAIISSVCLQFHTPQLPLLSEEKDGYVCRMLGQYLTKHRFPGAGEMAYWLKAGPFFQRTWVWVPAPVQFTTACHCGCRMSDALFCLWCTDMHAGKASVHIIFFFKIDLCYHGFYSSCGSCHHNYHHTTMLMPTEE